MKVDALPSARPRGEVRGRYRRHVEDFEVEEVLGFEPDGRGEHLYLKLEKRGHNTRWVARRLAAHFGVAPVDVGYAGLKDRHAVARQWFSVRRPARDQAPPPEDGLLVLAEARHGRKLRPGEHGGNRFRLRLERPEGDLTALEARLEAACRGGRLLVPNYFGAQRFGRDGGNLSRARAWLIEGASRPGRGERGLLLSAARALLFNEVLAARVRDQSWHRPLPGDVLIGGHPSGPLWGRGRTPVGSEAARRERAALAPLGEWLEPLEHCGLRQARRALAAAATAFEAAWQGADLWLAFTLPPGSYATAVLGEIGVFEDAAYVHSQ